MRKKKRAVVSVDKVPLMQPIHLGQENYPTRDVLPLYRDELRTYFIAKDDDKFYGYALYNFLAVFILYRCSWETIIGGSHLIVESVFNKESIKWK
jgi:hypothetical protein